MLGAKRAGKARLEPYYRELGIDLCRLVRP